MFCLSYHFEDNIPLFRCGLCGKCEGFLESKSLIHIKNRGCCWYFPKYTLMDIKNILQLNRRDFIYEISKYKNTKISSFYIEVNGYFDEEGFKNYQGKEDFDTKLFFRLCPFIGENGCSIDYKLRPHPCNLYLCREVIEFCKEQYDIYSRERRDYYSYMNYYNEVIKARLKEEKLDLISNFDMSIKLIEEIEVPKFEARNLKPINILDDVAC